MEDGVKRRRLGGLNAHAPDPRHVRLVFINVVVFFLMVGDRSGDWPASFLVSWGGNLGTLTFNGEEWRLVTSMFLHGGFGHLGGNLICLLAWGSVTEAALGTVRFVLAYFAFGILASAASAWVNPDVVSVGASGAIAGVLGLMVVIWLKGDARVSPRDLLANIVLNAFMSFQPAVDGIAHVAGFVAGMGTGPLLFPASFVQRPADSAEPTSDLLGPPFAGR